MDLTDIDGVGPARSDSLVEAGYDSVDMLAMADPEELAADADIPEDTALDFVVQAQNMVADDGDSADGSESDSESDEEEDGPLPSELVEDAENNETDDSADAEDEAPDETEPVEEDPTYELVVDLETDTHYDAYMTALINAYEQRVNSNQNALDAIAKALDDARYNSGEVTHDLDEYELNTLHAAVSQQVTTYKGQNMIDHMDAMRDLLAQVNEVRNDKLF